MNLITGLRYKGILTHKEGEIDFTDNCGFTVVTGLNKDSRISNKQNNGSGKSTLFGMIPNVIFEKTPLADTKKKGRIHSKGSVIEFDLQTPTNKWTIAQMGTGYKIFRDGTDLEVRGQAAQAERVREILPITEDEWYSFVYLQSQRALGFAVGTPRARMSYITDVWRLDQYDVLRKYFDKQVDAVKTAKADFDIHYANLTNINDALNKIDWSRKKQQKLDEATDVVTGLSKKVKKLQTRLQEIRSLKKQVDFYAETTQRLAKLEKKCKYTKAELKAEYKLIEETERYEEKQEEYKRKKAKLEKKLAELGGAKIGKDIKKKIKALRAEIESMEESDEKQAKVRDQHDEATREIENLDDHTEPELRPYLTMCNRAKKDPMESLKEELGIVKSTLALSDLLHNHEDGKCPTCAQKINVKDLEKNLKAAKKRKGVLHSMIHALEIRNTRSENTAIIKELKFDQRAFYANRKALKNKRAEIEALEDQIETAIRYEEITDQLEDLKKPKKPKAISKLTTEEIEKFVEILDEVKALKARLAEFEEVPTDNGLEKAFKETKKKLKKVEDAYETSFKITVELGALNAEHKLLSKQRDDVSTTIEEIKPLLDKMDMFKALSKAYSNKGLKLTAMNHILYQLEQNYNRYASLIFAEPFTFTVIAKDDGVHIIVDRQNGHPPSDVRELSGAESDSFRLLHFLSCLIMAPADRRMNIAILDEPDSHMDEPTTRLFAESFIPFMRTLVPHIFLITQKGKHAHSNCSYLTVEKHKGVSRLKFDHKAAA